MMRRAARVVEVVWHASGTRASGTSGACSASAAACDTRWGVPPRADAGTRRWVSGEAGRGGESTSEAAARPASSSAASSSASPEALVRAGRSLEFGQAAELVFATSRTGRLGWDWHAWHFAASLVPAGIAYAWAQHILASDPEIRRMVDASKDPRVRGGASVSEANATKDGDADRLAAAAALDDVRRRLARLEDALADPARRDAGVATRARGHARGVGGGRAAGVVAEERTEKARGSDQPRRGDPDAPDAMTDAPGSIRRRWRAAWRRARRFVARSVGTRWRGCEEAD